MYSCTYPFIYRTFIEVPHWAGTLGIRGTRRLLSGQIPRSARMHLFGRGLGSCVLGTEANKVQHAEPGREQRDACAMTTVMSRLGEGRAPTGVTGRLDCGTRGTREASDALRGAGAWPPPRGPPGDPSLAGARSPGMMVRSSCSISGDRGARCKTSQAARLHPRPTGPAA